MKILLVDNGSSYINQLAALCRQSGEVAVEPMGAVTQTRADLLVLSGGHHFAVANHPGEYQTELMLIRHFLGAIIGVCLGFELLAYDDDAELVRLPREQRGFRQVQVTHPDPIFESATRFDVYEAHRWAVTSTHNLVPLAKSPTGIEIVRDRTRPIYGFQFHPEQIAGSTDGRRLFENAVHQLQSGHENQRSLARKAV